MKQSQMICSTCIYAKMTNKGLRCIHSIPARWESITDFTDFPEVSPTLSCGQGSWWGTVILDESNEEAPWLYSYGEHDEPEDD